MNLGIALVHTGRLAEAIEQLQRARSARRRTPRRCSSSACGAFVSAPTCRSYAARWRARSPTPGRGYRSTATDIRRFRQDLIAEAEQAGLGRIRQSPDFYNMSGCRNLCFHVQEHRLTIPQIRAFIDSNGLEFIGFVVDPRTRHEAESRFPSDRELDRWHRYESEHQNLFSGQYHFWMHKPR